MVLLGGICMKFQKRLLTLSILLAATLFFNNNAFASEQSLSKSLSDEGAHQCDSLIQSFQEKFNNNNQQNFSTEINALLNSKSGRTFLIDFCKNIDPKAFSLQYFIIEQLMSTCNNDDEQFQIQKILKNFDNKVYEFLRYKSQLLSSYKCINTQKNKIELSRNILISRKTKFKNLIEQKKRLIAILSASNNTQGTDYQISTLKLDITRLESKIGNLDSKIEIFNSQILSFYSQLMDMKTKITFLDSVLTPLEGHYFNPVIFEF